MHFLCAMRPCKAQAAGDFRLSEPIPGVSQTGSGVWKGDVRWNIMAEKRRQVHSQRI